LSRCGAGFRDFFGAVAAPGFLGVGAGLLEGRLQFPVVKGDQDLAWLDGVAFADENFVDAAADLGADANVASLDGAGALQAGVAVEPSGVDGGCSTDDGDEDDD